MPRLARVKSITGIYHIMLRGIDKRDIFLEDEDRIKFLENINNAKEFGNFEIYGYCLMDNHVHMLIKENEEIGISIKRITVGYVGWHNKKYERTGHLFQNRYLSEPVTTEGYLLTVLRYIHQNPVKAKMVNNAEDYRWSSYYNYYLFYNDQNTMIDGNLIKTYFNTIEEFNKYMNKNNDDECLENKIKINCNDNTLIEIISREYDITNLLELSMDEKNKIIKDIYNKKGASIRQLSRILGLGKTIVEKIIKKDR
jgi:REP element-mobilizing transposase RayT